MTATTHFNRRDFLRGALAFLAGTADFLWPTQSFARPPLGDASFVPDLHLQLIAAPDEVQILPGRPTRVWRYQGKVLKGEPGTLHFLSGYLPVLRVRQGQKVRIELINELPEPTNIHWHGLHVPARMDGHPRDAIGSGQRYVYEFEVRNRAGTYWFHAHPDGRTGRQVYDGLAGLLLISDPDETVAGLPAGPYDVPLVLQDRRFDADNQLVYLSDRGSGGMMGGMMGGMGSMMAQMMGVLGDRMLVNGKPEVILPVEARAYRLRLLNASNARIYKLAWSDGVPLTVIGTDGGLLMRPLTRPYVMLAPAERVDLWVDFSRYRPGTERILKSLPFAGDTAMGGMMGDGMMGGMMGGSSLSNGAAFPILRVRVARDARERGHTLSPRPMPLIPAVRPQEAVNFHRPKIFNITMGMMIWGINGRPFEMEGVTGEETVRLNTSEIWEFRNDASMGMMGMAHAIHVHGRQFRVLGRSISPQFRAARNTVSSGYLDDGWKDTVLVMPGERIRLLVRFDDYDGLFLYHCHMLEHEDSGLMRNYLIKA